MKKFAIPVLLLLIILSSCSKYPKKWDNKLNGTWIEVDPSTNVPLNQSTGNSCELTLSENYMSDCGNTPNGFNLFSDGKLYAHDGQIYEKYKILLKKYTDFYYDYAFDGQYMWLIEDYTSGKAPAANQSGARKYVRK